MSLSVGVLADTLRTEADAYRLLERMRWAGRPVCPHCGSARRHYFLTPKNGTSRKTRTGSVSERRVWKCSDCRKQFSVLTGTIFQGSKIPLRTWICVIFEMTACREGVAARDIERRYGLTAKSAWSMVGRITDAARRLPGTVLRQVTAHDAKAARPRDQRARVVRPAPRAIHSIHLQAAW